MMLFQSIAYFDSVTAACIETTSFSISVTVCVAMLCHTDGNLF